MTANSIESCVIAVLAKAPDPGRVKTRLIARLGAEAAAALHARLVVQALESACTAGAGSVELWCAPARHPFFERLAGEYPVALRVQAEGDLGQRMCEAFRLSLECAERAIVIGTDCPVRSRDDLRAACAALGERYDIVLGPVEDGGYHLIGLRALRPQLFEGIDWSTGAVMAQTRLRLQTLGLRYKELPTRWDVDRPEDFDRLRDDPALTSLVAGLDGPNAAP